MTTVDPAQQGDDHAARPPVLQRGLAASGIVGVVGFVAAWAIGGQLVDGYSGIDDAISQLAAIDSPARALMSAGFVAFGIGVPLFAQALRTALGGPAWIAATVTGLATLGVAVTPLGRFDAAHYVFAAVGYASLAATPLLAAVTLRRRGATRWANLSIACGAVSAALLAASTLDPVHGLTQRLGLGLTDVWIVVAAVTIIRRNPAPVVADPSSPHATCVRPGRLEAEGGGAASARQVRRFASYMRASACASTTSALDLPPASA